MARSKTPGYREAIAWIADNDDTECLFDEDVPTPSVTMSMVADLFDRPIEKVMADVTRVIDKNMEEDGE